MNEDDLHEPKLTPAPQTSPLVRGAAVAVVTVSLVVTGCSSSSPGAGLDGGNPGVADAGISIAPGVDAGVRDASPSPGLDATPGVDAGHAILDSGNPGA